MKTLTVLLPLLFASALCFHITSSEALFEEEKLFWYEDLQHELTELVKEKFLQEEPKLSGVVTANFNDYLDEVLVNVKSAILNAGYDPVALPDQAVDIVIGTTNLTEGTLNDTSSITRYQDATLSYDNSTQKLSIEFVLRWESILLLYKYHTKVTFISMTGHVHADVEHIKVHVKLGFDFSNYTLFVDSLDFKDTGSISVWFSGNSAIDWITNAMSKVMTTLLHSVILNMIKKIVMDPIQEIVNVINLVINGILHPSATY